VYLPEHHAVNWGYLGPEPSDTFKKQPAVPAHAGAQHTYSAGLAMRAVLCYDYRAMTTQSNCHHMNSTDMLLHMMADDTGWHNMAGLEHTDGLK
jgi:hypothetical protein